MIAAPNIKAVRPRRRPWGAVVLLQLEVVLLTVLPAKLTIVGLKGVGSPALLLGMGMLLLWVVSVLMPGAGVAHQSKPVRVVLAIFWIAVLVAYAARNAHSVPAPDLANSDRTLLELLAFTGVALTAAEGLKDKDELLTVLRAVVLGVGFMAFVAILQFRPGIDLTKYIAKIPILRANGSLDAIIPRGGFNRPSGTAIHPIELGVIVGSTLAFAMHLAIYDRKQSRLRRLAPACLIAITIPISVSRSALITAAAVLIYFFVGTTSRLRRKGAAVLAAVMALVFVLLPGMIGTLKGLVLMGKSDSSISHRTDQYAAVASYIRASPWVGHGPGTFLPTYRILDNQYLLSLIEIGMFGVVALLALFFLPAALGRSARHRSSSEEDRNLGQMFAGAGMAALVGAATFDAFSFPTFTAFVAFWVGLSCAWWSITNAARSATGPTAERQSKATSVDGPATLTFDRRVTELQENRSREAQPVRSRTDYCAPSRAATSRRLSPHSKSR